MKEAIVPRSDVILTYADFLDEMRTVSEQYRFYQNGVCPHCEATAPVVHYLEDCGVPGLPQSAWARSCSCGWWEIERLAVFGPDVGVDADGYDWAHAARFFRVGILRSFHPQDRQLPVSALREALSKKPDLVYSIHHRKMEELVASVMADFVGNCEVELCGRSGDGGIDLILIIADTTFAIQVKRRTRASSVEGVDEVRMFLAAMKIRGVTGGLFITTADHFSSGAKRVATTAVTKDLVSTFELIDRHRFFGLLEATQRSTDRPVWRAHIEYDPWGA
jgi:restriction system protein